MFQDSARGIFYQTEAQNETKEALEVLRLRLKKWAVINIGHRGKDNIDCMHKLPKSSLCVSFGGSNAKAVVK